MNETQKKPVVTVRNILKILSVIVTIIVFCPTFLVSCSGETIDVSVMTAVGGMKSYGEYVVEPHPIMLVCLLIPVAILVILFMKKFADGKAAIITAACGVADLIIWFIFRSAVKKTAEENYCTYKATGWFTFNIIVLIAIIVLSVLVILKILQMEDDLIKKFSGQEAQSTFNQMSAAVTQVSSSVGKFAENVTSNVAANVNRNRIPKENIIGYCSKCGNPLTLENKFCTSCGTPVPESMIAEAEAARQAAEEAARREAEEAARREEEARKAAEEARRAAEEAARQNEQQAVNAENTAPVQMVAGSTPAFCKNCGAKLSPGSVFCESCGTKVN